MNGLKALFPFLQTTHPETDRFDYPATTHPEEITGTSQTAQILAHMKAGHGITGLDALHRFGCFRLPARIADIKKMGHDVKREMIEVNGKRVARYWMDVE